MYILNENHDGGKNLLGHAVIIKKIYTLSYLQGPTDFLATLPISPKFNVNLNSIRKMSNWVCESTVVEHFFFCMIRRNRWEKRDVTDLWRLDSTKRSAKIIFDDVWLKFLPFCIALFAEEAICAQFRRDRFCQRFRVLWRWLFLKWKITSLETYEARFARKMTKNRKRENFNFFPFLLFCQAP